MAICDCSTSLACWRRAAPIAILAVALALPAWAQQTAPASSAAGVTYGVCSALPTVTTPAASAEGLYIIRETCTTTRPMQPQTGTPGVLPPEPVPTPLTACTTERLPAEQSAQILVWTTGAIEFLLASLPQAK